MMKLPDELRHPSGGESIDRTARDTVRLAHRALDRFPGLVRQHKFLAGGAAISSALVALAGVAISRRMKNGESGDEAVESVTEDELGGLTKVVSIGGDMETAGQALNDGSQLEVRQDVSEDLDADDGLASDRSGSPVGTSFNDTARSEDRGTLYSA